MKSLLLLPFVLSVTSLFGQSSECEFPETFVVDKSSIVARQWIEVDGKTISDTVDYSDVREKIEIPDSVVLEDSEMIYFYSEDNRVTTKTGSYKISDKRLTWKLNDGQIKVKSKWKKDDLICFILSEGISGTASSKNKEDRIFGDFLLMPKGASK
ncbi:hypothetical protein [Ekhidna sp.]|uniref:hypothetical protein n=1 Tax=Ekhidna sp. TaxID=2608089 RepID=UPI003B507C9F